jgi:class 3 adenylate cyclase/tetratricopeptide (TPR) repeat protein
VTVLFADLVESTAMAEGLDPEVLAVRLADYFERMRSIIEGHGGTVEKFIGDAVVGVFGVPVLHEDDALRAVRAALEMAAATAGLGLHSRLGINTGEVVAVAGSSAIALGHPINMAARLQQAAEPDTILMGESTQALVQGRVEARLLGRLSLKGATEPVTAWHVDALVETAPRGWQGSSPFVGRQQDLAAVESSFDAAVRDNVPVLITVIAPPGLGKSRLAAEAAARLRSRSRVVVGRCVPYGEATTYAPLIDIIRQLEAEAGDGLLDSTLDSEPDGVQVLATLRALVAGTAMSSPEETAWAFRRLLESLTAQGPLVAVFDDIHWANSALLDLLDYIATFSSGYPILMLCLARPDLLDSRPDWTGSRPNSHTIRLQPLSPEETDALLPGDVQAADLRRRIVEAADGVPLFVEQMAALQHNQAGEVVVPASVRALMAARVDQLDPVDRSVLECGAVEGETFQRATVNALLGNGAATGLGGQLVGLIKREFIRPERSAGGDAFRFSHALLREAVYGLMPRRQRAEVHERLAELLRASANADEAVIAHHLETAYRERAALGDDPALLADLAVAAGVALLRAGQRASAQTDWRRAVDLLSHGAELLLVDPKRRLSVLPDLMLALIALPDLDGAQATYESAVADARRLGDTSVELYLQLAHADLDRVRDLPGWPERSLALTETAISFFEARGDSFALALAYFIRAKAMLTRDIAECISLMKQAQLYAERTDHELIQAALWDELGGAMLVGPTPYSEIISHLRREQEWARARGSAFAEADALLGEVYGLIAAADWTAARAAVQHVKDLFASLPGVVTQHGESYVLAGQLELDAGNPAAAEHEFRRAMELFEAMKEQALVAGRGDWARQRADRSGSA